MQNMQNKEKQIILSENCTNQVIGILNNLLIDINNGNVTGQYLTIDRYKRVTESILTAINTEVKEKNTEVKENGTDNN
jgi:hypothetical protein